MADAKNAKIQDICVEDLTRQTTASVSFAIPLLKERRNKDSANWR